MNKQRMIETLQKINEFGSGASGVTRLAYTKSHREALDYFISLCKEEGLQVRIDEAGNVIARREGICDDLPAVACGSHLDTVTSGGDYDGALGVAAALEAVRSLNEQQVMTEHPIEIIAFACEESSRFGVSMLGSKMMAGLLRKEQIAGLSDRSGMSIQDAFAEAGLDFEKIETAVRKPEQLKAFLELHIEQGPVLEENGAQVGIVTGIAAPTRFRIHLQGKASHSGTTPMNVRRDALTAAAEIVLVVERAAKAESRFGTVGTVGVCDVKPGAMNVIPDSVDLQVDIRGTSSESKQRVAAALREQIREIESVRNIAVECRTLSDEQPVQLSKAIFSSLLDQCRRARLAALPMISGAGHDAMSMSYLCPTGLIFIPCRDGLSHHPDEYASPEDMSLGAELLEQEMIRQAVRYEARRPLRASN